MRLVVTSTLRFFVAERLGFCCFKTHLLRSLSAENVHTHIRLYVQCLPTMFQKFHMYVAFWNIIENAKRAGKTCFARYSTRFSKRVRYRICNGHLQHYEGTAKSFTFVFYTMSICGEDSYKAVCALLKSIPRVWWYTLQCQL